MRRKIILNGRSITRGVASGEALVTKQAFMFPHGIDPKTGVIIDKRHELKGQKVLGKVFVFPYGKGSTTGGAWVLEVIRNGCGPSAIINIRTEPIIATGVILAEILYNKVIPVIDNLDKNPLDIISSGDYVTVNADRGIVEVIKAGKSE